MELDKKIEEFETELKVVKGEIKGLLVDIRDLVNRNENPFYNIQKYGVSGLETDFPEAEFENENNKEIAQESANDICPDEVPEKNKPRQETVQAIEPENQVRKIDTFALIELMRWVDYAVRTVGHSNLRVLLNLYSLTGHLPEKAKCVIENITSLPIEEPEGKGIVNMKDNITVLAQLNAILNPCGLKSKV
jgi:archaellum component FlaD/FlaE